MFTIVGKKLAEFSILASLQKGEISFLRCPSYTQRHK